MKRLLEQIIWLGPVLFITGCAAIVGTAAGTIAMTAATVDRDGYREYNGRSNSAARQAIQDVPGNQPHSIRAASPPSNSQTSTKVVTRQIVFQGDTLKTTLPHSISELFAATQYAFRDLGLRQITGDETPSVGRLSGREISGREIRVEMVANGSESIVRIRAGRFGDFNYSQQLYNKIMSQLDNRGGVR